MLVGTGNGQLLFAFSSAGYTSLTGVDYSSSSIELAQSILSARLSAASSPENTDEEDEEEQKSLASPPPNFFVADVLEVALGEKVQGVTDEKWDLVTDKGTYDAVCLADETREGRSLRELYIASVAMLLPTDGIFLITSCAYTLLSFLVLSGHADQNSLTGNWTQPELEKAFANASTGSFSFLVPPSGADRPPSSAPSSSHSLTR